MNSRHHFACRIAYVDTSTSYDVDTFPYHLISLLCDDRTLLRGVISPYDDCILP